MSTGRAGVRYPPSCRTPFASLSSIRSRSESSRQNQRIGRLERDFLQAADCAPRKSSYPVLGHWSHDEQDRLVMGRHSGGTGCVLARARELANSRLGPSVLLPKPRVRAVSPSDSRERAEEKSPCLTPS